MDMFKMMQQLQGAQSKMEDAKKQLDNIDVVGNASGGAVTVTLTASKRFKNITISPDIVDKDDVEQLEDLVAAAITRALDMADAKSAEVMHKCKEEMLPPGFNIPGLF